MGNRANQLLQRTQAAIGRSGKAVRSLRSAAVPASVPQAESAPSPPPQTVLSDRTIADIRHGLLAAKQLGATLVKAPTNQAAISVPEICAVNYCLTRAGSGAMRIAELGTYTGHTANILASLSHREARIEIYDFFEHNDQSRKSLANHPAYDSTDFFAVWAYNTREHSEKFVVNRGDLNESKNNERSPLDILFVDIVKHESVVNTVVDPFYDRLRVGGFLLHQDYYHWQSPWLVYQMEMLEDAFTLVGDFGNNMSVYVKRRPLTEAEKQTDYVDGLSAAEKYDLFDRAIQRFPGLRAGNLMASKLRLSIEDGAFDSHQLFDEIQAEFGSNARISGYADRIMLEKDSIANTMW